MGEHFARLVPSAVLTLCQAGLIHNGRVFLIAVFASLGGLLYGYNQGVFSGVLKYVVSCCG